MLLRGDELTAVNEAHQHWVELGAPDVVARNISESLYAFSLLDIVERAITHNEDATALAHVYFELSAHLGVDKLLLAVSSLPRGDRWHSLARLALREDLYRSLRDLAVDVCGRMAPPFDAADTINEFETYHRARITRSRQTLTQFLNVDQPDLAVLSVASAKLRSLTAARN